MPTVFCSCEIPDCKAAPHAGKPHCSASCDAPTWGEDRWSESDTSWDGALDWNVAKIGDRAVPVCRDCNHMMAVIDDRSGEPGAVGRFDQSGMTLQNDNENAARKKPS